MYMFNSYCNHRMDSLHELRRQQHLKYMKIIEERNIKKKQEDYPPD